MIDRRPALIARPLDVDDVAVAVRYAVDEDLPIAVRGGGHSVAGHCIGEGGVVVDLRLMRDVFVDPAARLATCGGGALWEDLMGRKMLLNLKQRAETLRNQRADGLGVPAAGSRPERPDAVAATPR
jgi:hypothetical protein